MEHRPVPVRVGDPAKPLGAGSDGPLHAADRRLWHPCWNRGLAGPLAPDVSTMRLRGLSLPTRLSSDHDPLYRFHQWRANLRVLQVIEVKSVPYVPRSHPFVERLIGTTATRIRGSAAVLACVGLGRQTGRLPRLLQCASGPCVVGRADARPDTKGCRTARPLPMARALPWSLSDADRGVTSDQRRRWRSGRRARVRRLSRHSRAVRHLQALLMPSRQRRRSSRLTGPEDRTMWDSYEFATHRSPVPLNIQGNHRLETVDFVRMCCNFPKAARERLVESAWLRLMPPPRTSC